MKTLIICKSIHHGNTKKIADAMAEVLNADVIEPEKINPDETKKYGLIGFGSGIYFGKHHKELLKLVDKISGKNKKAFIFSTHGIDLPLYHKILRNKLKNKEFNIVGEFSCRGYEDYSVFKLIGGINKGHPNKEDLENAKKFAENIKKYR
ncbi:flavodoxin family protein [Methanothermococcus sp.]|uniref:flavodoxin family protein n=1 Tax=Methanothermococcus sp. TaxID=2614238 RepID=UPI0025E3C3AA|nr:flavodoxin family protein [Methanothermococcus sp.]